MSYNKRWAKEHPEQAKRHRQTARQNYREKTLKQIYEVYGDRCVCCGEAEPTMLCLDHINNDGAEHRRKIGVEGSRLRRWVVKNNFPAGLQTLCNNCNMSKELNGGICAHLTTEYIDLDLRSD